MPEPELFIRGFDIYEGMNISGYRLSKLDIDHHTVVKWNVYSYPIKMIWVGEGKIPSLISEFRKLVDREIIIRSSSGRPYKCLFLGKSKTLTYHVQPGKVIIMCTGYAKRVPNSLAGL